MQAFSASSGKEETEKESSGGLPFNILAGDIRLNDGFFSYEKEKESGETEHIRIENIRLRLQNGNFAEKSGKAELELGRAGIRLDALKTEVRELHLSAALDQGNLSALSLKLDSDMGNADISGDVSDPFSARVSAPALNVNLNLQSDLAEIWKSLGLKSEFSGPVRLQLQASGKADDPETELKLHFGGGKLAGMQTDSLELLCRMKNRKADIPALRLQSEMGNLDISGQADLSSAFPRGFFSAQRDLNALSYSIDLKQSGTALEKLAARAGISGKLASVIKAEGRGVFPGQMRVKADAEINGEQIAIDKVLASTDAVVKTAAVMEKGIVHLNSFRLDTAPLQLEGTGNYRLDSNEIQAKLHLDNPDFGGLLTALHVPHFAGKLSADAQISGNILRPAVALQLHGEKVNFQDIRIGDLRIQTDLNKEGKITLSELFLENSGSEISARGNMQLFREGFSIHPDLPADILLTLRKVEAGNFIPAQKDMQGSLSGSIHAKGPLLKPHADADLNAESLAFASSVIGNANARFSFADGLISLKNLDVRNRQSALKLSGTARLLDAEMKMLPNPEFDLKLASDALYPGDFLDNISGKVSLKALARGSIQSPHLDLLVKGSGLAKGKDRIGDLDADISFAKGIAHVKDLELQNGRSEIQVSGTARIMPPDSLTPLPDPEFDLKISKGSIFPGDFSDELTGHLLLSAEIRGKRSDPRAYVRIEGKELAAQSRQIGNLDADLRFEGDSLRVEKMQIKNGKSGLDIQGQARILNAQTGKMLEDPEFDIKMSGDALFLEDFFQGMQGKLAVNGHVSGSKNRPKGNVSIEGGKMDLGVQQIAGLHLNSRLDGERVNIDSFLLAMAPGEEIVTDGWISPLRRNYDIRMKSEGISMKHIDALRHQDFGKGRISFRLSGKGSFDNPTAEGDITIEGLTLQQKVLDDLHIRLDIRDHLARFRGDLHFNLDAVYHLKSKDFTAKLLFDKSDLSPFFSIAGRDDLGGVLSGIIAAEGNSGKPENIQAKAEIASLDIFLKEITQKQAGGNKTEFIHSENLNIFLEKGKIRVPGIALRLLREGNLNISGAGNLKGPLDFRAEGNIPLRVVRLLDEELQDISGSIRVNASLKGSAEKPDFQAVADLQNIGIRIPGLLQKLHDMKGQIHLGSELLELKGIEGQVDEGSFTLSGNIKLKNFQADRMRLHLKGERIPVSIPDTADILFSTDLNLRGKAEKSRISGEVVLLEGQYFKDVKIGLLETLSKVGERSRAESAPDSAEPHPLLKNMALDINLISRNPFTVDNNIALILLRPDLKIGGTAGNPVIGGRAEVSSGTIIYQSREFDIQKGVVDFLNPYKTEPAFDIQGEAEIRKWTVFLHVSGTQDNLKFELRSDPREEHADILSLLVLGKTTKEMISGEGGSTSATQLLADALAEKLGERLKESTALDTLELGYTEGETAEDSEIKVTVGKELSRRLSVKYGVETRSGETVQTATTEYKFLENLLMSAFQDTEGEFGGELIFRLEFR
ncbi:MAG: translocation/assembly module TamB domain-containing protein [Desulfococcaceae bacterium]|nr:translocation/assembly module TamB domain-containing protein [Desulfococcaceae bacterium]